MSKLGVSIHHFFPNLTTGPNIYYNASSGLIHNKQKAVRTSDVLVHNHDAPAKTGRKRKLSLERSALPSGLSAHETALKLKDLSNTDANAEEIKCLHHQTFIYRRQIVLSEKDERGHATKLMHEFPKLIFSASLRHDDFIRIVSQFRWKPNDFEAEWSIMCDKIVWFSFTNQGKLAKDCDVFEWEAEDGGVAIADVAAVQNMCQENGDLTALKCLVALSTGVRGHKKAQLWRKLFCEFKNGESKDDMIGTVKCQTNQPVICKVSDGLEADRFYIMMDRELVKTGPTMAAAIKDLIEAHYVFWLKYDVDTKNIYRFFELMYGIKGVDQKPLVTDLHARIRQFALPQ